MKAIFKSKTVWIIVAAVVLAAGAIITILLSGKGEAIRASKQLSLGEKYLSEFKYEEAIVAYNKVIEIEPKNIQAYVGLAEAYVGLEQPDNAINTLESAVAVAEIEKNATGGLLPGTEDVFVSLALLYENQGDRENGYKILQKGYELTGSSVIAELLKKFLPSVEASIPSGTYKSPQMVTLLTKGSVIYYTINGSEPNSSSAAYSNPIEIGVGVTALKVAAENEFGELGEVITYTYNIEEAVDLITPEPSAEPTPEATPEPMPVEQTPTPQPSPKPTPTPQDSPVSTPTSVERTESLPTETPQVGNNDVIVFKERGLEYRVRKALNKPKGDITKAEAASLTELDCNQLSTIKSLDDIVYFPNLKSLGLDNNKITDITPLRNLNKLEELGLYHNNISDISVLGEFDNLHILDIGHNPISDIKVVEKLTNLTDLGMGELGLSDISFVGKLINLKELYLGDNQISNIDTLSNLANLEYLHLENNQISDISVIGKLTKLNDLDLSRNQIIDISALKNINPQWLNLEFNQITDWTPVAHIIWPIKGRDY